MSRRGILGRAGNEIIPTVAEVAETFGWLPKLLASFATRRFSPAVCLIAVVVAYSAGPIEVLAAQPPRNPEASKEEAFRKAAALVSPSVVRIETVGGVDQVIRSVTGSAPTSGVVVSEDGFLITSTFNFAAKPSSVVVALPDGRRLAAQVVSTDHSRKLALLKVDAKGLTPARAAKKNSIRVGQWAIALGRTYDEVPNVSVGIVSALNRIWGRAIQTDAKVSPMNYGGPLIDLDGNVLGILVPLSPQSDTEVSGVEWYDSGIGFAVPLEDVLSKLSRMKAGEDLRLGLMGIMLETGNAYSTEMAIHHVRYNSPAQQAGVEVGDTIVEIDGQKVARQSQFRQILGTKLAGESAVLRIRRGEQMLEYKIALVEKLEAYESAFLGVLPDRNPKATKDHGVRVRHVFENSPAGKAGLQAGDRITHLGDASVTNAVKLLDAVSRLMPGESVAIEIERSGSDNSERSTQIEKQITLTAIPKDIPERLPPFAIPNRSSKTDTSDFKTGSFINTDIATQRTYWAYVPEDYNPTFSYGLVVCVTPAGNSQEGKLLRVWKNVCDSRGLILFAPRPDDRSGWTPADIEVIRGMVERFQKSYKIDTKRVVVHGFSLGGPFAAEMAFKHREMFRGLILAASAPVTSFPDNRPDFRFQLLFVCGKNDDQFPGMSHVAEGLRRMKYPVSVIEIEGLAHEYPPAASVQVIGRWMDMLDRI